MNTSEAIQAIYSLLDDERLDLPDGKYITTSGAISIWIETDDDAIVIRFDDPQPIIHATGIISISEEIEGITIRDGKAKIHIDKVPEWLEPVIELK